MQGWKSDSYSRYQGPGMYLESGFYPCMFIIPASHLRTYFAQVIEQETGLQNAGILNQSQVSCTIMISKVYYDIKLHNDDYNVVYCTAPQSHVWISHGKRFVLENRKLIGIVKATQLDVINASHV